MRERERERKTACNEREREQERQHVMRERERMTVVPPLGFLSLPAPPVGAVPQGGLG